MDDMLTVGSNQAEHNLCLGAALQQLQGAEVTLNSNRCTFFKDSVRLLGQDSDTDLLSSSESEHS